MLARVLKLEGGGAERLGERALAALELREAGVEETAGLSAWERRRVTISRAVQSPTYTCIIHVYTCMYMYMYKHVPAAFLEVE